MSFRRFHQEAAAEYQGNVYQFIGIGEGRVKNGDCVTVCDGDYFAGEGMARRRRDNYTDCSKYLPAKPVAL